MRDEKNKQQSHDLQSSKPRRMFVLNVQSQYLQLVRRSDFFPTRLTGPRTSVACFTAVGYRVDRRLELLRSAVRCERMARYTARLVA